MCGDTSGGHRGRANAHGPASLMHFDGKCTVALQSKATAMRAHLERLKLLEMRNQDPDASGKQRTGNRTFFMSNGP